MNPRATQCLLPRLWCTAPVTVTLNVNHLLGAVIVDKQRLCRKCTEAENMGGQLWWGPHSPNPAEISSHNMAQGEEPRWRWQQAEEPQSFKGKKDQLQRVTEPQDNSQAAGTKAHSLQVAIYSHCGRTSRCKWGQLLVSLLLETQEPAPPQQRCFYLRG